MSSSSSSLWAEVGVVGLSFGLPAALMASVGKVRKCASFPVLVAIFGGIGGYLMRVYKAIALGTRLQARYDKEARSDTSSMVDSLQRIERHLHVETPP